MCSDCGVEVVVFDFVMGGVPYLSALNAQYQVKWIKSCFSFCDYGSVLIVK